VDYSVEFQARLADELEACPANDALTAALLDYGRERKELRAR
jgi:hypothetical protein